MGCDIHLYVEVYKDGNWISADEWEEVKWNGHKFMDIPYGKAYYDDRNYNLFAILADVRNGYGFAGVKTGFGFKPIDDPRGLPFDVSEILAKEGDNVDYHSHSWFTVQELMDYDWTQTTELIGVINAPEYLSMRLYEQDRPRTYCADVTGKSIIRVDQQEMNKLIDETIKDIEDDYSKMEAVKENLGNVYTAVKWSMHYYECASKFLSHTLPRLWRLGYYDQVRIVFWFDN